MKDLVDFHLSGGKYIDISGRYSTFLLSYKTDWLINSKGGKINYGNKHSWVIVLGNEQQQDQ